ncbi:MAG: N-acetylmuramoyl-L-alanine amidase [Mycobacterium sp.]
MSLMQLLRVSGWVAVIIAAPAVLIVGVVAACRGSAPSMRPAGAERTAPAVNAHSTRVGAGGGGRGLAADMAVDPAHFSPGACVAFPPVMGNRHLTVFPDAGHGGLDPGAVGITSTGTVIDEADQTLPVVLDSTAILRRAGFRVVVSRTGPTWVLRLTPGDVSGNMLTVAGSHDKVAARDVCATMAYADVLVGVYFNSGASGNAGCITACDRARPFAAANLRLADLVQSAVLAAMNAQGWQIPDGGVQPDQGLGFPLSPADLAYGHLVLLGPAEQGYFSTPSMMPGALVEPLFSTDPFEGSIAASSRGQQVIAAGLARAIEQYFAPEPAP